MSDRSRTSEVLADLARVIARWGDRWFLCGAQAVLIHGVPRLTADVDVTVALSPEDPGGFAEDLASAGFTVRVEDLEGFVQRTRVVPVVHAVTGLPVDIILAGPGLEEQFLARAVRFSIGGVMTPVVSAEDLVVMKVLAGRPKDVDDARGVLQRQIGRLDTRRMLSLLAELDQALDRSDLLRNLEQLLSEFKER